MSTRMPWCLILSAVVLTGAMAAPSVCAAQAASTPVASATLSDLDFIPGQWRGELEGGVIEEFWSPPEGDNIMGVFRYVKGGAGQFYEIMLIEQTELGPVLRLKHFSPKLVGWETKEQILSFPLVELAEDRAVFARAETRTRLVFHRTGPDTLVVTLEETTDDGVTAEEFAYTRLPD